MHASTGRAPQDSNLMPVEPVETTMDERSLADSDGVEIVESTVTPTPENFDLDAWVQGVRPTRRSVQIHQRSDLLGRIEQLAALIDNTDEDQDVDALIDEYEALEQEFNEGVWFTVEARSADWLKTFREDFSRRRNLKIRFDKSGDFDTDEVATEVSAELLAAQIVEQVVQPAGLTVEHVLAFWRSGADAWAQLIACVRNANGVLATAAGPSVMGRDFSRRRSGRNATRAS